MITETKYRCTCCETILDDKVGFRHQCGTRNQQLCFNFYSFLEEYYNIDKIIDNGCFINENGYFYPCMFYILFEKFKIKFELESNFYGGYTAICTSSKTYHWFDPIVIPKNLKSQVDFNNFLKREVNKIIKRIKLAEYEL